MPPLMVLVGAVLVEAAASAAAQRGPLVACGVPRGGRGLVAPGHVRLAAERAVRAWGLCVWRWRVVVVVESSVFVVLVVVGKGVLLKQGEGGRA